MLYENIDILGTTYILCGEGTINGAEYVVVIKAMSKDPEKKYLLKESYEEITDEAILSALREKHEVPGYRRNIL